MAESGGTIYKGRPLSKLLLPSLLAHLPKPCGSPPSKLPLLPSLHSAHKPPLPSPPPSTPVQFVRGHGPHQRDLQFAQRVGHAGGGGGGRRGPRGLRRAVDLRCQRSSVSESRWTTAHPHA